MLQRNLSNFGGTGPTWWQDLGHGAPTIAGFATLCSQAIGNGQLGVADEDAPSLDDWLNRLSIEAKVLLSIAASRGTFEIRAKQDGFDSVERFLAVAIEAELDVWRLLLDKANARQTIRFLEGFAQLCECGMVVHHLQREFSLSSRGFDAAAKLREASDLPSELLKFGE